MDPTSFIKFPLIMLKTVGLEMSRTPNDKNIYQFQPRWIFVLVALNMLYNFFGQINEIWLGYQSGRPLQTWIIYMVTTSFIVSATTKGILINLERQCFSVLLNRLNGIFPKTKKDQAEYHLNEYLSKFNKISITMAAFQLILGFHYGLNAMLVDNYLTPRAATETHELMLPFGDNYPYYTQTRIQFVLIMISQFWCGQSSTALSYALNLIVVGLVWQLCMHYNHLRDKLKSFDECESVNSENEHLLWCIRKQNHLDG